MRKVTMGLTDRDVDNTNFIREVVQARSNAQVVSIALSLTRFIVAALTVPGAQLLLRNSDGTLDRVIMSELENITGRRAV
jgi:hypothetical protein